VQTAIVLHILIIDKIIVLCKDATMDSIPEKRICEKCGEEKLLEEFYLYNKEKGKRRKTCKKCFSDQSEKRREKYKKENEGKEIDLNEKRACIYCKEEKPYSEFSKHISNKNGINNACKKCETKRTKEWREKENKHYTEYHKEYYQKNKEEQLEKHRKYYEENKEAIIEKAKTYYENNSDVVKENVKSYRKTKRGREVKRNSSAKRRAIITDKIDTDFLIQLKESTEKCPLCGCLLSEEDGDEKYHLDHIIPLNIGGSHSKENVRYICRKCNLTRPKDGSDTI
jgi:hypothetical protein